MAVLDYTLETAPQFQPLLDCAANQKPGRCVVFDGLDAAVRRLYQSFERT